VTAIPTTTILLRALAAGMLLVATALIGLPSTAAHAAGQYQVRMSGYAFTPRVLTITAGSTVTWTNQDTAPHDVQTTSGPHSLHSPMLDKGGSWSHTFTSPGAYRYLCTVHPDMTGQLIVKAAAAPRPSAAPSHRHEHEPTARHQHAERSAAAPPAAPRSSTRPPSPSAASPTPSAASSAPAQAQAAPDTQPAATAAAPLQPLLLLTGAVAGVAVLCLLLVGSRSAAARRTEGSEDV
jgi:amicyanin